MNLKLLVYILKRILYAAITIFVLITVTFFMMRLLPGDPFTGGKAVPEETMAALEAKYGLDKPLWQQYFIYMGRVLQGDLGSSLKTQRAVTSVIGDTFPVSLDLGLRALCFAFIMGVLLGIIAAVKRGTFWDSATMFIALIGVSVPSFIIGSLLQYFLALKLNMATGTQVFAIMGWGAENSKVLPAFALAFGSMAIISRLMRTSMLEVLHQDYIMTAKAKGLSQKTIIWKHADGAAGGGCPYRCFCRGEHFLDSGYWTVFCPVRAAERLSHGSGLDDVLRVLPGRYQPDYRYFVRLY